MNLDHYRVIRRPLITEKSTMQRELGNVIAPNAKAVAVDAAGNSYVTGSFHGTASFGTIKLAATPVTEHWRCHRRKVEYWHARRPYPQGPGR